MKNAAKSKAEQKYAELQKKDMSLLSDIEKASKVRSEKSAKLRKLRLEKEAADKVVADAAAQKAKDERAAKPAKRVRRASTAS
jgi:hypothetical protein